MLEQYKYEKAHGEIPKAPGATEKKKANKLRTRLCITSLIEQLKGDRWQLSWTSREESQQRREPGTDPSICFVDDHLEELMGK